mmetsp:Transcript_54309/g.129423  ORF Transcript_54309/g.129423 Transcript_54309/m.129423 type:complete len:215 (-) Transcript_54309:64-708(-)
MAVSDQKAATPRRRQALQIQALTAMIPHPQMTHPQSPATHRWVDAKAKTHGAKEASTREKARIHSAARAALEGKATIPSAARVASVKTLSARRVAIQVSTPKGREASTPRAKGLTPREAKEAAEILLAAKEVALEVHLVVAALEVLRVAASEVLRAAAASGVLQAVALAARAVVSTRRVERAVAAAASTRKEAKAGATPSEEGHPNKTSGEWPR